MGPGLCTTTEQSTTIGQMGQQDSDMAGAPIFINPQSENSLKLFISTN
jgi:hypothetical protein